MPPAAATLDQARAAKDEALKVFSRLGSVVGVGITRVGDSYAVKVNLRDTPDQGAKLPRTVQGVPVRVDVVGPIRKR
jgi:hypothetical protein